MNDELVNAFHNQSFKKVNPNFKMKNYNPEDVNQLRPIERNVGKKENSRMRKANITDRLTSVDFRETAEIGGKVVEIFEGKFYKETFKVFPFKKFKNLFKLRLK